MLSTELNLVGKNIIMFMFVYEGLSKVTRGYECE